jgi:hypothetical protein
VLFHIAVSLLIGAIPLAMAAWLLRRVSRVRAISKRRAWLTVGGGVLVGIAAVYLEKLVLAFTGLSFEVTPADATGPLLATFLLAAPLEEGLVVLAVWPQYNARQLISPRLGLFYAASAACGFAAAKCAGQLLLQALSVTTALRTLAALPAYAFFAGIWGYSLGSGRTGGGRWFAPAWLLAVAIHGLYNHIVFGRGPALLGLSVPLLAFMTVLGWIALRDVAPQSGRQEPVSGQEHGFAALLEPPSLREMRHALRPANRPLKLHWIAIGALVTLGVMITSLAAAVYVGHRVGIDFALADEADVRASGPLFLLGTALLAAFPVGGFLVSHASAADSVLEPAIAAALAIAVVVAMLSVTAPVTVVIALAVAPVAFSLACAGAWFGGHH